MTPARIALSRVSSFVTGGGAGIGEAACPRFAEEGAHVVAVDWDGEAARETVETIERAGGPGNSPTACAEPCGERYGRLLIVSGFPRTGRRNTGTSAQPTV